MKFPNSIDLEKALQPAASYETRRLWERMESAYYGGESFRRRFLWRHEREDEQDWQQRLSRSVYENHLRDLINRRESIIFSRRISRSVHSATLPWPEFSANVDGLGNSWSDFIRRCFTNCQIYGFAAVFIDKPAGEARTALEESQSNYKPCLRLLHPGTILNWGTDHAGSLQWITTQQGGNLQQKRLITRNSVRCYEGDGIGPDAAGSYPEPVSVHNHQLGAIPLVILHDLPGSGNTLGTSSLQSACDLSILYFNQSNWYDQLLYKTNYSTLAATPFGGANEEPEMIVGSGDVFWVPEGGMAPSWISPDTAPADVFERRLAYMRRRIYELAALDVGHVEDKSRDLSGVAYAVRRLPTEEMALRISRNLAAFEKRLIETYYAVAGHRVSVEISYPSRYGVRPLRDAIKDIETIERSRLIPEEVKRYIASQIVFTEGFADLSEELQSRFEDQIRTMSDDAADSHHV